MRPRILPTLMFAATVAAALFISPVVLSQDSSKPSTPRAADAIATLDKAEDLLRTGSWSEGQAEVAKAIQVVLSSPLEGDGGSAILGRALALRAIAAAGIGDSQAARFDAIAVESFDFDPRSLKLASFGKAGEVFEETAKSIAASPEPQRVGGGVSRPEISKRVNPSYSVGAREVRIQGVTIAEAVIDASGRVVQAKIVKPLHPQLDFAGLDAIRQWTFEPAQLDSKPVPVHYVLTINFRLE